MSELQDALDKLDNLEKHMNKHGSFGMSEPEPWAVCRKYAHKYSAIAQLDRLEPVEGLAESLDYWSNKAINVENMIELDHINHILQAAKNYLAMTEGK